jgi:DNA-binding transcriptional ArsR family regulator
MKDTKETKLKVKRLSHNEDYYTNVFKRIEKLVSVLFYILSYIDNKDINQTHVERIKDKALKTHEVALETLTLQAQQTEVGLERLQFALLRLDSVLRIAGAANVLADELLLLTLEQIDGVQRYLNNHYTMDSGFALQTTEQTVPGTTVAKSDPRQSRSSKTTSRPRKVAIPEGDISSDAYLVYSQLTDRAERIKTVLEAKPQASIKDIAEVITDVSEKTIQRELNSLIEKGQVVREGERRWSRYSVAK